MRSLIGLALATLMLSSACAHAAATAAQQESPPGTATEPRLTAADLQARMKTIQGAVGAVQMKLAGNRVADAAKDAQTLATMFGDVERFWSQHNRPDAITWARQARTDSAEMAGAAAANDAGKANAAASRLASTCQQCHATYREGDARAGYHLRPGVL